ncbi:MAG: nuclear transport factor 2 family protein [Pseudolabrys sp.]|nr:nuclear transport factor 2 family protein [Pseudolabrys sp.]MDP2297280.1 nuclear transport factor 2 family protein [Pseudolabrys sp.]
MSGPVSRTTVEGFYVAYDVNDAERIAAYLDDDVEWIVFGPPALMQVCGQWRGKAAVFDRFSRLLPQLLEFKRFERHFMLVDGDESAACGRIIGKHRASGRIISHRSAHFIRYRDQKVIAFRAVTDSLDAAEQYIGHRIDRGTESEADMLVL